ncbi:MAG: right-handed parallel beta-helix repeat-containing protein [Bacteroidota bacterium]
MILRLFLLLAVLAAWGSSLHAQAPPNVTGDTVYFVDGNTGRDDNAGQTLDTAWKTINKAAQTLQAGDVVYIRSGIYYESVYPANSGVTYSAYPEADSYDTVVISGAAPVTGWIRDAGDIWAWDWNPADDWDTKYGWFNIPPQEGATTNGTKAHILRRELLFADQQREVPTGTNPSYFDGHMLVPTTSRAHLETVALDTLAEISSYGAFFVETDPADRSPIRILARFLRDGDPNAWDAPPVIAAREHLFWPGGRDAICGAAGTPGDLTVRGLIFRHANSRGQDGAVCPGDRGALFEDVTVEHTNGVGIDTNGPNPENISDAGEDHTFRRVTLQYNGQTGISGECDRCTLVDSKLYRNNTKFYEPGWEAGGMKFSYTEDMVVRRVEVRENRGPGLWLDALNYRNVIEGCTVQDNWFVGILLEYYTIDTLVQHNLITGSRRLDLFDNFSVGSGLMTQMAPRNTLVHNTVTGNDGNGVFLLDLPWEIDDPETSTEPGWDAYYAGPYAGLESVVYNNLVAGNARKRDGILKGEAYEIQLQDTKLPWLRTLALGGNRYEDHSGDAAPALGLARAYSFATYTFEEDDFRPTDDLATWQSFMETAEADAFLAMSPVEIAGLAAGANWQQTERFGDAELLPVNAACPTGDCEIHCYAYVGANPDALLSAGYLDDAAAASCSDGPEEPPTGEAGLIAEAGVFRVEQGDAFSATEVRFSVALDAAPIVVLPSFSENDAEPAVVRVRNLSKDGFDLWIDEWDYLDGQHGEETVPYLVMLDGTYRLSDGRLAEGGRVRNVGGDYQTVAFDAPFEVPPVVFSQVTALAASGDRISRAVLARVRNVTATSFEVKLQGERAGGDVAGREHVSWIALAEGVSTGAGVPAVGTKSGEVDHHWEYYPFGTDQPTPDREPVVLVQTQTEFDADPVVVRYRNLTDLDIEVRLAKDDSDGTGTTHANETIGYAVLPEQRLYGTGVGDSRPATRGQTLGTAQVFPVQLLGNYPNPVFGQTRIRFSLNAPQDVRVEVFDLTGRRVATVVDGTHEAGVQDAAFDTAGLASGIYLYRFTSGSFTTTRRLTIVR